MTKNIKKWKIENHSRLNAFSLFPIVGFTWNDAWHDFGFHVGWLFFGWEIEYRKSGW